MEKLTPYRQVAKEALMNWNGLTESEADKIVLNATREELENQVWATGSMTYAVEALCKYLNLDQKQSQEFLQATLGDDSPYMSEKDEAVFKGISDYVDNFMREHAGVGSNFELSMMRIRMFNSATLKALAYVHDGWVKDNAKKFNKEGRANKKYQHLPLEMIGWREAEADLLFIKPIVFALGQKRLDTEYLEETYWGHVTRYFVQSGLVKKGEYRPDPKALEEYILKGKEMYNVLTEENTAKSEEDVKMMIDQVLSRVQKNISQCLISKDRIYYEYDDMEDED